MDNPHNHDIAAGAGPPRSLFADETAGPLAPQGAKAPAPVKRPSNVLTRIVLPASILLGGIAFIAWVAQYLPSSGRNRQTDQSNTAVVDPIRFEGLAIRGDVVAQFFPGDDANKGYVPEYELGSGGHYDFPFFNSSDAAADLGILEFTCACSGAEVCLFKGSQREQYEKTKLLPVGLKWQELEKDKDLKKWISVPAQGGGLLRITWRGTKAEPDPLFQLNAKAWSRPTGGSRYPNVTGLVVRVNYVRAVMFEDTRIDLGSLNPKDERTESFMCWSATSDIDVKSTSEDPRIKVVTEKLDAKACADEQKRLREGVERIMTRVRSAFKITVTLYEQRDGIQLDMGYFAKPVPLTITSNGQTIQAPLPLLRAHVRGPVYLSPQEEGGRIDFKVVNVKLGANKKVTLFSTVKGVNITYGGCDPSWFAPSVTIMPIKVEGDKTQWEMDVAIKPDPDGHGYALPENSHLTLECEIPGIKEKRIVRIAIAATVGSH